MTSNLLATNRAALLAKGRQANRVPAAARWNMGPTMVPRSRISMPSDIGTDDGSIQGGAGKQPFAMHGGNTFRTNMFSNVKHRISRCGGI